jgi:hypothetical protein
MAASPNPNRKLINIANPGDFMAFTNLSIIPLYFLWKNRIYYMQFFKEFFGRIQFLPFVLGFAIGIFIVYVLKPAPVVVMKYPNLDNAAQLVYRDRNGTCFQYDVQQVDCDKSEDRIKPYPLQ